MTTAEKICKKINSYLQSWSSVKRVTRRHTWKSLKLWNTWVVDWAATGRNWRNDSKVLRAFEHMASKSSRVGNSKENNTGSFTYRRSSETWTNPADRSSEDIIGKTWWRARDIPCILATSQSTSRGSDRCRWSWETYTAVLSSKRPGCGCNDQRFTGRSHELSNGEIRVYKCGQTGDPKKMQKSSNEACEGYRSKLAEVMEILVTMSKSAPATADLNLLLFNLALVAVWAVPVEVLSSFRLAYPECGTDPKELLAHLKQTVKILTANQMELIFRNPNYCAQLANFKQKTTFFLVQKWMENKASYCWTLEQDKVACFRKSLPNQYTGIDDIIEKLAMSTVFTQLDLLKGYYQVEIREQDRCKTAFRFYGQLYTFL